MNTQLDDYMFTSVRYTDVECHMHIHRHLEIILVDDGILSLKIGEEKQQISKGQGVFLSPFKPHQFFSQQHNRSHIIMFSNAISSFTQIVKTQEESFSVFSVSEETHRLIDKLLPLQHNNSDLFLAQAVLAPLYVEIYAQCGFRPREFKSDDALENSINYVHNHFCEPITLESTAKYVGIHPVTLSKNFSLRANMSFKTYLNILRCSYATELISKTNMTMTEIAFLSGYESIRSFNRNFMQIYGITPSEYRKNFDKKTIL